MFINFLPHRSTMRKNDLILGAVVVVAAYLAYRYLNQTPTTQEQAVAAFRNAGLDANKANAVNSESVFVSGGIDSSGQRVTYQFQPGDFDQLNFAQKILIGADRFIPGSWLSRQVLA